MSEHPIQSLMDTTLQKIRDMVDVNTIIGDQIVTPDGTVIIPVSKVSMGFASGGSDIGTKTQKQMFGGGGGAGFTIKPVAFITVSNGQVKLLQIEGGSSNPTQQAVALVPEMFDKITALFDKGNKNKKNEPTKENEQKAAEEKTCCKNEEENN